MAETSQKNRDSNHKTSRFYNFPSLSNIINMLIIPKTLLNPRWVAVENKKPFIINSEGRDPFLILRDCTTILFSLRRRRIYVGLGALEFISLSYHDVIAYP